MNGPTKAFSMNWSIFFILFQTFMPPEVHEPRKVRASRYPSQASLGPFRSRAADGYAFRRLMHLRGPPLCQCGLEEGVKRGAEAGGLLAAGGGEEWLASASALDELGGFPDVGGCTVTGGYKVS